MSRYRVGGLEAYWLHLAWKDKEPGYQGKSSPLEKKVKDTAKDPYKPNPEKKEYVR